MITIDGITIDRATRTITHRGRINRWNTAGVKNCEASVRFKVMTHLILGGGMSKHQIFSCLYANDPEGGPLSGPRMIDVVMQFLKPIFWKLDLELRTYRIAGVHFYEVVPTYQIEARHAAE